MGKMHCPRQIIAIVKLLHTVIEPSCGTTAKALNVFTSWQATLVRVLVLLLSTLHVI